MRRLAVVCEWWAGTFLVWAARLHKRLGTETDIHEFRHIAAMFELGDSTNCAEHGCWIDKAEERDHTVGHRRGR